MAKSKDNTTDMTKKTAKSSGRTSVQSQNSAVKATKNMGATAKSSVKTGKSAATASPKSGTATAQKSVKNSNYTVAENAKSTSGNKVKANQASSAASKRAAAQVMDEVSSAKKNAGSPAAKTANKTSSASNRQIAGAVGEGRRREVNASEYSAQTSGVQRNSANSVKMNQAAARPDVVNNQNMQHSADEQLRQKGNIAANNTSVSEGKRNDAPITAHSQDNVNARDKKDKSDIKEKSSKKSKKKDKKAYSGELKRVQAAADKGLTAEQVRERVAKGCNNVQPNIVTKSYLRIFRSNVMTLFNAINFLLAALVLVFGSIKNMTFIIMVIGNMIVGIVQEIRSKRVLEKMSLLNVPKVSVIRDGESVNVDISDVVLDDIMEVHAGEQIASDAVVVSGECEVNESLLTGEQDDIHKVAGAELLSGSIVQAGYCRARVMKVGKDNFASTILAEAKKYKKSKSQLMRSINWIIRIVTVAIFPLGILMYLTNCADKGLGYLDMFNIVSSDMADKVSSVVTNSVASVVGMIPEGLVMMTSIALAVGVIKLARKQTLVQDLYSIETLARVDMLCLDKTGTITEGTMQVEDVKIYTERYGKVEDIMTSMVAALGASGSTFEAIAEKFTGEAAFESVKTVPFSSARKWSGADFGRKGRFIVGAPEFVLKERYESIRPDVEEYGKQGFRVLVLVYTPQQFEDVMSVASMSPVALIILSDKIRENAEQTLRYFAEQGVNLKVISGDNPITVSKVAERAGLVGAEKYIDATKLVTDEDIYDACDKYVVFGRVTPKQKKTLVMALKSKGYTVGMTGDGVNDVMALKEADCSIAMASGSEAARNVAQLVLMNSDFASLPSVVAEGRRVINNIERVASLFLVKTTFSICLTLLCIILQLSYPFVPIQLTLISSLFVGMPSFFLALEPNNRKVTGNFLTKVFSRALPAGLTISLMVTIILLLYHDIGIDVSAQIATMAFFVTGLTALLVLMQVCYPYTKMRLFLIFLALVIFIFAVSVEWTREFFSINTLTTDMITKLAIMLVCIPPCMLVMRVEVGAVKELVKEIKNFFANIRKGYRKLKDSSLRRKNMGNTASAKSAKPYNDKISK